MLTLLRHRRKSFRAYSSDDNPGTTNLVGDWSMDETSGTRVDSHGSNDLTDNNTVGYATGVISNASSFVSANSEYLSSTTVPVTGTDARSLEVWFKTSTSGTMHIVGFGGSSTSTNGAAFRLSIENGSLFCRVYGGYAGFGGSWNDGAWHQVVLKVMDSGYVEDLEMYVDGSSQTRVSGSNLTLTAINTGTDSFFVGQNIQSSATQYFNGDVDILRVFNDELTADEITWLYNSGSGRSYSDISGATDYRSTIIADNPVAYYRLGEASGSTASDEMGSSDGTYGSDTTYGVTGALAGDSNTSVSFAGSSTTNAAVQVSSLASANFSSGITIELWLKWNSSNGTGMPVEVREGNDGQDRIFFDARSSGTPHWDLNIAGTWYSATGAGVQDGWHLYAFTHDGTNAKTYRDGVLQNTTSASATTFSPDAMGIGQDGNGYNVFYGGIDEVAVYNTALTATELLAHYTAGAGATPLQTRTVTFSATDASTFTIDSDSGQEIWTDDKLNQASVGDGLRFWNGSEAGNSGATYNSGNNRWSFSSASDSLAWWENYWVRVKQDPGTGTYSDWINFTNADGDIEGSAQAAYLNIGDSTANYSGPGTWTTHAAGFKYQVEIYSDSNRP